MSVFVGLQLLKRRQQVIELLMVTEQFKTYVCLSVCLSFLQARSKLSQIQDSQHEVSKSIEQCNNTLNGTHGGSMTNLADMSETYFSERENGVFPAMVRRTQVRNLFYCM